MNCEVCRDLVGGLRRGLEGLEGGLERVSGEAPGLVLWMAFVGGGGAPDNTDRRWFVELLGICLKTAWWDEVEERLEGWPWRPKYCWRWREFWKDVVTFKRVIEVDDGSVETG